uniref:Uncharacterized protein n=1 Tax=Rhizophora mucronata TaxID=61149 RepID=A0A2P2J2S5_RHIMU
MIPQISCIKSNFYQDPFPIQALLSKHTNLYVKLVLPQAYTNNI